MMKRGWGGNDGALDGANSERLGDRRGAVRHPTERPHGRVPNRSSSGPAVPRGIRHSVI